MAEAPELDWDAEIRAHNRRVVVSLLAMGLQLADAEDLAQKAWIKLIEKHDQGKLREVKLPGLVIKQARFLALSALRQDGKKEAKHDRIDAGGVVLTMPLDPEHNLVGKQQLDRALALLKDSHETSRRVFRLLYDDPPPSHAEVAEKVGISIQRVRQILWETRKKMRAALREDEKKP